MATITKEQLIEELQWFTCTEEWHRHSMNRRLIYTDGVKHLAEKAGAYWLIDVVASYVGSRQWKAAVQQDERFESMSFWVLNVRNNSAIVAARVDSDCPALIKQEIEYTDFPLDEVSLYLCQADEDLWTLMLPSEY